MIDREHRQRGAQLLAAYLAEASGPGDFEVEWHTLAQRSTDPSLKPIGWAVWLTYDDLRDTVKRTREFTSVERRLLEQCIQFLQSDAAYTWNTPRLSKLEALLADPEVLNAWPFARRSS